MQYCIHVAQLYSALTEQFWRAICHHGFTFLLPSQPFSKLPQKFCCCCALLVDMTSVCPLELACLHLCEREGGREGGTPPPKGNLRCTRPPRANLRKVGEKEETETTLEAQLPPTDMLVKNLKPPRGESLHHFFTIVHIPVFTEFIHSLWNW